MNDIGQDLRYGLRALARNRSTTLIAVLSLGLGIGVNAVVFSLVNALLLRPLPVADAGRLVRIGLTRNGQELIAFSHPAYRELAGGAQTFEGIIGHQPNNLILNLDGDVREEEMEIVTGNYFSVLGLPMARGRGFLPEEDRSPGTHPVVVISHELWLRRFAGDPDVVGRQIKVNGYPFSVVGVAPEGFKGTFAGFEIGLWVPVMMLEQALPDEPGPDDRDHRLLMLIGRLQRGATMEGARADLARVVTSMAQQDPERFRGTRITLHKASGVHPSIAGVFTAFLALLMGIVGLVLLIACANVTNLLLARGAARAREIAVRFSLGATRRRLIRQLLTESLLLSLLAAASALLLAVWLSRAFSAFRPPVGVPIGLDVQVDWRVFGFTLAVAVGTTLVFGLIPAFRASKTDLTTSLKVGGLAGSRREGWLRDALVVGQVAVSAVLLAGAALVIQSLVHSRTIDPGFDPERLLVLSSEPGRLGYDEDRTRALWTELETRTEALPGVVRASLALFVPLGDRGDQLPVAKAEDAVEEGNLPPSYDYNYIGPGYFSTMDIPIVQGRDISSADMRDGIDVAVVTQAMAARLWPGEAPVGKRLRIFDREGRGREVEVVGVARDHKYRSLGEASRAVVFLPYSQWYRADMRLHIRTVADPARLVSLVREVVRSVDPELPARVTTMNQETAFSLVPVKLAGAVLGFAGAIGTLLATIGIFGVVSYTVTRQTREIGVRMALGATVPRVRRMVLGRSGRLTALGVALGLGLAALATRLLRGLLYGVSPTDPATFSAIALLFAAVSVLASYLPARRATRVEPAVVLREE